MKFKSKKKLLKFISFLIIFLFLIIFVLFFIQFDFFEKIKNNFDEPEYSQIKDECAMTYLGLIHKLKNEGECKIACQNYCNIKGSFYFKSDFVSFDNTCNTCDCYCK